MKAKPKYARKFHAILLDKASENIVCLLADSNYTHLIFSNGSNKLVAYHLGIYDQILPNSFLRVNRSCTINKRFFKAFNFQKRSIILANNKEFLISKRRWLGVHENINL